MLGFQFSEFKPQKEESNFDNLLKLFLELLTYTGGDVEEAISWMNELDKEFNLTSDDYAMGDFIQDLKDKGYLKEDNESQEIKITAKAEQSIRKQSLEEIFGKLKKSNTGNHRTGFLGKGDEKTNELKPYEFGDKLEDVSMTDSLNNAFRNHGIDKLTFTTDDLEVYESEYKTQTSTVLMIDISHSMILYGEDRITPAKKVAMALSELITTRYPKDSLDIVVFGNDAWTIEIKDLPYLKVGPYHTNTVAGLELAIDILRRKKAQNKQIFMITDGKPSCLKEGNRYYKNSFGLDRKITNKCLNLAGTCRKQKIPITTFMIAKDPYLQKFVQEFTEANNGKAFYSSLKGLGTFIFEDYEKNRRKNVR